ncbi:MAG: CBS domain-containing protein [Candidatus Omnitrophica bacterium]|nr:CBS domain-containing protein [Candidatus Omnitrophota bacterium]
MPDKNIEELLKQKRIAEIVNPRLVRASWDITVAAAIDLMQANRSAYVVLTDGEAIKGIFTEVEVAEKILGSEESRARPVRDFMNAEPVFLSAEDSVGSAIDLMAKKKMYYLPLVASGGRLTGVLSVRTLIRFLAECYPTEVYNLPPDPGHFSDTPEGG